MPNYRYKARDKAGKAVQGMISGENRLAVAHNLEGIGYILISIEEIHGARIGKMVLMSRRVTLSDLNMFTRQLFTLQKAGLPLLISLEAIAKELQNQKFKDIVKDIALNVETGTSLSSAMEKHPQIFDELYVNMIRAGEAGGILEEILARLADLGEKELDTRAKIKSATRYPLIASVAIIAAFFIITAFIIPKFSAVFAQFKTALPLPTRALIFLSVSIRRYWYVAVALAAGAVYWFRRLMVTSKGRLVWDTFTLKMPVLGDLLSKLIMSRLTRVMAILIRSGLPILQVLDIASRSSGNVVISKAMAGISASVKDGKGLSGPMEYSGIFPPIVIQMVAVGEETGKIDELLENVSQYFDREADYMIKNLTVLIEPVFVLFLGIMVLIMALAIFLPMWNIATLFRH